MLGWNRYAVLVVSHRTFLVGVSTCWRGRYLIGTCVTLTRVNMNTMDVVGPVRIYYDSMIYCTKVAVTYWDIPVWVLHMASNWLMVLGHCDWGVIIMFQAMYTGQGDLLGHSPVPDNAFWPRVGLTYIKSMYIIHREYVCQYKQLKDNA